MSKSLHSNIASNVSNKYDPETLFVLNQKIIKILNLFI